MPKNAEYLIFTYVVTTAVISVYLLQVIFKLKRVKKKLHNLKSVDTDEK